jgi:hypothetical protein
MSEMLRPGSIAALAVTLLTSPVDSRGADHDLRCTNVDQMLSERLRAVVTREPPAAQAAVHEVMLRMASARIDCKRGRTERGLRVYAGAETSLAELEAVAAASAGPAGDAVSAAAPQ